MRLPLLLAALAGAAPALAQPAPDSLRARPAPPDACASADPLRGRLLLGATACPLGPGEGHVSVRGLAVLFFPVLGAVQGAVGAGRGVVVGGAVARNVGGNVDVAVNVRAPVWERGGLRVAAGVYAWRRSEGSYAHPLSFGPSVVATVSAGPSALTLQLVRPVTRVSVPVYDGGSYRRRTQFAWGRVQPSAGVAVATGRSSQAILEVSKATYDLDADGAALVAFGLRTFGRRSAFEIGVGLVPSELDACADAESFCLPPILPHASLAVGLGRRPARPAPPAPARTPPAFPPPDTVLPDPAETTRPDAARPAILPSQPPSRPPSEPQPFAGRLIVSPTATPLPQGHAHVGLRAGPLGDDDLTAALSGAVGVGRGVTLGATFLPGSDRGLVALATGKASRAVGPRAVLAGGVTVAHQRLRSGPTGTAAEAFGAVTVGAGAVRVSGYVARRLPTSSPGPKGFRYGVGADARLGRRVWLVAEGLGGPAGDPAAGVRAAALRFGGGRWAAEVGLVRPPGLVEQTGGLLWAVPHASLVVPVGRR